VEENTGEGESELRRGWEITEEKLGENTGEGGREHRRGKERTKER
jgi:hypothetical protein